MGSSGTLGNHREDAERVCRHVVFLKVEREMDALGEDELLLTEIEASVRGYHRIRSRQIEVTLRVTRNV